MSRRTRILIGVIAAIVVIALAIAIPLSLSNRGEKRALALDPTTVASPVVIPPTATTLVQPTETPSVNNVVAPVVVKVHGVEWREVGTARAGNEVFTLGIPWSDLIQIHVPRELEDNLPGGTYGISGIAGALPTERGTVILFAYTEAVDGYTYWKAEIPLSALEGLSP